MTFTGNGEGMGLLIYSVSGCPWPSSVVANLGVVSGPYNVTLSGGLPAGSYGESAHDGGFATCVGFTVMLNPEPPPTPNLGADDTGREPKPSWPTA